MRPPVGVSANIFRTLVAVNAKGLVLDQVLSAEPVTVTGYQAVCLSNKGSR